MPAGFFSESTLLQSIAPVSEFPQCGLCGLHKTCSSPKMPPSGKGKKKVLLIGEAPGNYEDEQGTQFVGKSGQYLASVLRKLGVDMRRDCWITNSLICRPPLNRIDNDKKIDYCRPNVYNAMERFKPNVVVLLGGKAIKSLIEPLWGESVGKVERWLGWNIPSQKWNAYICPTWHPAYLLRETNPLLDRFFEEHLRKAFSYTEPPWQELPDYDSQVECIFDPDKAIKAIYWFIEKNRITAFDYETDRLKPDAADSEIVCCSLSNGIRTVVFPWLGKIRPAMRDFLRSRVPKVGSNVKFEERWTLKDFGIRVRNWVWDTMLSAHAIDNRPEITGLKFQSLVLLGVSKYNKHVQQLLSSEKGGNIKNQIRRIDMSDLLLYCGLDSLFEYLVARKQMRLLK